MIAGWSGRIGGYLSDKTPEQLRAEINAIEADMKKERDAALRPFRAIWGVASGLMKITWAVVKIPLGALWHISKAQVESDRKLREKMKAQRDQAAEKERVRSEKLAELKKQLKDATK